MISLLTKLKTWYANKQEEAYPLNEAPDENEDTAREMPTPKDDVKSWFKLTFKF